MVESRSEQAVTVGKSDEKTCFLHECDNVKVNVDDDNEDNNNDKHNKTYSRLMDDN